MDFDEYREYYFSRSYFRNRILLIACLVLAIGIGRWTGLLDSSAASGMTGRMYAIQLVVLVIAVGWVVIAVLGVIGLYRWLRAD
ncbi:hypothetical protein [Natronorubrum sp. FCH18a]|uniref:hypothetical protein n=1 Tax=Natronorubrum sp. FCH18a TaxID=3447018 RepID=UPI003F50E95D